MTFTYTNQLTVIECCNCHMDFAMPEDFAQQCRDERPHKSFYCPAGHAQHFTGKTDKQKALDRATRAEAAAEREQARAEYWIAEQERTERRRRAAQGQITKIKRRIGKGVCPCCNRHFANVDRHMQTQHPDYAEPEPTP